jgi:hypothetical protein
MPRHYSRTVMVRGVERVGPPRKAGDRLYSPSPRGASLSQRKPAVIDSRSAYNSVGAVVRWDVRRIIGATEAIVVNATNEMMSSDAKVSLVDVRHATRAKAVDVVSAETSDATNA